MDEPTETPPEQRGGGALPLDPVDCRDTRLVGHAVRKRWPIPEELRPKIAEGLAQIASSKRSPLRNRIHAARALVMMDAQNMEQEKRDQQIPDRLDITSGGKPLPLAGLSNEQLQQFDALLTAAGFPPPDRA